MEVITDGAIWFDMIKSRNLTSHLYDETEILKILEVILNDYLAVFTDFEDKMKSLL